MNLILPLWRRVFRGTPEIRYFLHNFYNGANATELLNNYGYQNYSSDYCVLGFSQNSVFRTPLFVSLYNFSVKRHYREKRKSYYFTCGELRSQWLDFTPGVNCIKNDFRTGVRRKTMEYPESKKRIPGISVNGKVTSYERDVETG